MKTGFYVYEHDEKWNPGRIVLFAKETEKQIKLGLVECTIRYEPILIDAFKNNTTILIRKDRGSQHAFSYNEDDCFCIYPYRMGKPFPFEYKEEYKKCTM